jgi:sugar lactone lactonase YvrE
LKTFRHARWSTNSVQRRGLKDRYWKLGVSILLIVVAPLAVPSRAMVGDTIADRILGQVSFLNSNLNFTDARGLISPIGISIDKSVTPNRLYVVDSGNNRVLGYRDITALTNGAPADLVIGQPDFFSERCNQGMASPSADSLCLPFRVAVDVSGDLYVADEGNSRVLEFTSPFASCGSFPCIGGPANFVFGQGGTFASGACNGGKQDPNADSLCHPEGVALDTSGNLYVSDPGNGRVLEYNTPLLTDTTADLVIGQASFASNGFNGVSASSVSSAEGLALDGGGNLYVADRATQRVLEYNSPIASCGSFPCIGGPANLVFGQGGSFTSDTCNNSEPNATADSLCGPRDVAVDASGHLFIADWRNSRVLEYSSPLTNRTADIVFGQAGSFTARCDPLFNSPCGPATADSLFGPNAVALDALGNLYVTDSGSGDAPYTSGNNRVLEYNTPLTNTTADLVLGQGDFAKIAPNFVDALGFNSPGAIAIDKSVTPNRLYVADSNNNRVLGYRDITGFTNGAPADLVIGQPDFLSAACNQGGDPNAGSLCGPQGVATDPSGNLFVADHGNNRVFEYTSPLASCASFPCIGGAADRVFGQGGNFTSTACTQTVSAGSLCNPAAVVVDSSGQLYIADSGNNRVLEFDSPLKNTNADFVFGQGGSFTARTCSIELNATTLCNPDAVAVDAGGHLYIADNGNNRVLEYNAPLASKAGTTANQVFGTEGSFTSSDKNCSIDGSPVTASTLCGPNGLAIDSGADLYIADNINNRVLEYNSPLTNTTAGEVFGQSGDFTASSCNQGANASASNLCGPTNVAVDSGGNLYIADASNNRVLEYDLPLGGSSPTPTGTPTPSPNTTLSAAPALLNFGNVDATGTSKPKKVTLRNNGGFAAQISTVTVSAPFTLAGGQNTCTESIAPKKTCSFEVEFAPAMVGSVTGGSVRVTYNGLSPVVTLGGDGVAVILKSPRTSSFAPVNAGSVGAAKNIVFSNPSTVAVTFGTAVLAGSASGSFKIGIDRCSGQQLAPKATCGIGVEFAPPSTGSGAQSAILSVGFTYGTNQANVSADLSGKVK